jgi:hypothetical protein
LLVADHDFLAAILLVRILPVKMRKIMLEDVFQKKFSRAFHSKSLRRALYPYPKKTNTKQGKKKD